MEHGDLWWGCGMLCTTSLPAPSLLLLGDLGLFLGLGVSKCNKTSLGLGGEQRPQAYKGSDSDCWLQFLTEPEKPLFLLKTFHARLLLLWGGVTFPVGGEGCRHEACYSSSGACSHWERGRPQGPGMAVRRAELHAKFGLRPESMHTNIFLGRGSIALIRFSKIQNLGNQQLA